MIFTVNTLSKVFALTSFILSTLCLFAGSERSIMQNASVMLVSDSNSENHERDKPLTLECSILE